MEYSREYLEAKKIVIIEEIAKMISANKHCWDIDLSGLVNNQLLIGEIGKALAEDKTDKEIVREIRNIFDRYEIA